jgi:tetratricopeptide (TPR) repeat protein
MTELAYDTYTLQGPAFTDADRAEALFRLGACRLKGSSTAQAISLLTLAIELFERSPDASGRLKAHAFVWRARGYQRRRDWEAARADVERALELADALRNDHMVAHAMFQGSLVAEREGQWHMACYYAEEARERYAAAGDELNVARRAGRRGRSPASRRSITMSLLRRAAFAGALVLSVVPAPALAVTNGVADGNAHPAVGLLVADGGATPVCRASG